MASTTRITISAEATVDCPAERAVIRFRRGNLYDKQLDRPTITGSELKRLVLDAGAEDIKVIPSKGKVIISITDLTTLGSVLANLRNLGPVKKPNTSFEVSDETHELLVAEAIAYAVEQARAGIEPTKRMLHAETAKVVDVQVKKTKAVAGTWNQLSSRALNASAYVKVDVTFELPNTVNVDISGELREYYDRAANPDLDDEFDNDGDIDPFGGAVFGTAEPATVTGEQPTADPVTGRGELAESVGVAYKHSESSSGADRPVSLDGENAHG